MIAGAAVSIEEYLRTSFSDLDKEYRDGEIVERSLPDYLHGWTQGVLFAFFFALRGRLPVYPCVETRMRIRRERCLIPDVAVFYPDRPELLPETPPLIAIEILSLGDPLTEVRDKLEEYRAWGVPHVWLVDAHSRRLYSCDQGLLAEQPSLTVPELGIELTGPDVFQ